MDSTVIVLVDPEHRRTRHLLRGAANKIVLHYSWVDRSLNSGHPLVESNNWGGCKVTLDNINDIPGYVLPPDPSNLRLQTSRPAPVDRSHNLSTFYEFPQVSGSVTPPSSQPQSTATPSRTTQTTRSPGVFPPFPTSRPADMGTMAHGQHPGWPPPHPEEFDMIRPPTQEELRCAHRVMMWFQRLSPYQQLPIPPTTTKSGPIFYRQTQPPPGGVGIQLENPTEAGAQDVAALSHQDSTNSRGALPDPVDPPAGPPPNGPPLPTSPQVQSVKILPSPPPDNRHRLTVIPAPAHTYTKLFEHDVKKPMMFYVPIVLKRRGRLAEIFRVSVEPSLNVHCLTKYIP